MQIAADEQKVLAARATPLKDRSVNIRMTTDDLGDIQVCALEEGVPYQTLIASVAGRVSNSADGLQQNARMVCISR